MKKILFTLLIVALFACPVSAQRYRQHQVTIVDEFGDAVTNIDIITIIDVGTSTNSTIYSTRAGTARTNPMTTTSGGFDPNTGIATWFQAAPTYKITVTESGASQSLTIDNQAEGDTRFPFYANYIGTAASLTVGDAQLLNIGTSADFTHDWDVGNTRYVIAPAGDGGSLHFGKATIHTDIFWHTGAATTGDYVMFNEGAANVQFIDIDLLIDDESKVFFGDSSDVTIEYDESNEDLDILSTSALDEISWGATGDGYDQIWHSTTAGDYMLFGYSTDSLLLEDMTLGLGDTERIVLGGTIGTGSMFISVTSNVMEIGQIAALTGSLTFGNDDDGVDVTFYGDTASQKAWWDASGDEWFYGANAEGVDVTWYGDTASSYMKWDENGETNGVLIFEATDLHMMDADYILLGDGKDFSIHSTTTKILNITPAAASDDYQVLLGSDQTGVDLGLYGTTASEYLLWDASADSFTIVGDLALFTLTGTTKPFYANVTGTVAGVAIELKTTDGGVKIDADGGSNGDITLDSADDIILTTAGKLTITNTEAMTVSGASTLTGAVTATAGVQSAAVTVTATADGLTTGLIPSGTRFVTVASDGATKVVVLPASVIGNIVTITVPATGCELQTLATTNETINTVDCDGTNELALVAGSVYTLTCTKAITWVATGASNVGANEDSLTPDAD